MSIRVIGPLAQDPVTIDQTRDYIIQADLAQDVTTLYKKNKEHDNTLAALTFNDNASANDLSEFELTVSYKIIDIDSKFALLQYITLPNLNLELNRLSLELDSRISLLDKNANIALNFEVARITSDYDAKINNLTKMTLSQFSQIELMFDASISDIYAKHRSLKSRIEKVEIELHSTQYEIDLIAKFQEYTTSTTLSLSDKNKLIQANSATAMDITVPPNSDVEFQIGISIAIIQLGIGQVTIVPGSGVTLLQATSLKTSKQYSVISLTKADTDTWYVAGDTAEAV